MSTTPSTPAVASFTTLDPPPPPPGAFVLTAPADAATDVDSALQTNFTWGTSTNAVNYTITVATTVGFDPGTIVVGPTGTGATSIPVVAGTFTEGTTYFWRVVADNGDGDETTGTPSVASFTTIEPIGCAGDIDGDGFANLADFNILAVNFGFGPGAVRSQGDLNGDTFVNLADFNILAVDFGCVAP